MYQRGAPDTQYCDRHNGVQVIEELVEPLSARPWVVRLLSRSGAGALS